jgi:hypothetical protein
MTTCYAKVHSKSKGNQWLTSKYWLHSNIDPIEFLDQDVPIELLAIWGSYCLGEFIWMVFCWPMSVFCMAKEINLWVNDQSPLGKGILKIHQDGNLGLDMI